MVATTKKQEQPVTLVKKGVKGVVRGFKDDFLAQKLMSMGILPGTKIEFVRVAPLGGACYVKADNLILALRKTEALGILLRS